jgi:phosphoglycolate phosphatase-like HAD superfamily hydrolase
MDIQAAANAGLQSVLVRTGNAGRDGKYAAAPDYTAADVAEAAGLIIDSVAAKETAR